jgi:hypothetical protein
MGLGLGREIRDEVQLATPTEGPFLGYVGTSLKSEQHAEVSRLVLLLLHGLTRFVTRSLAAIFSFLFFLSTPLGAGKNLTDAWFFVRGNIYAFVLSE